MQKLIIIIPILLMCGQGWGATIYVRNSAASPGNSIMYKSGSWPPDGGAGATDNSTIRTAISAAGAGGTVILDGGIYAGTQFDTDGHLFIPSAATIRGAYAADNAPNKSSAIVNGDNAHSTSYTVRNAANGTTFEHLTIQKTINHDNAVMFYGGTSNFSVTFNDVTFDGGVTSLNAGNMSGGAYTFNNVKWLARTFTTTFGVFPEGVTVLKNYGTVDSKITGAGFSIKGNYTANNINYLNNASYVIGVAGNPSIDKTITLNNCILAGNSIVGSTSHIINMPDAYSKIATPATGHMTVNVNNSVTLRNPWNPDSYGYKNCTLINCISDKSPKLKTPRYPSIAVFAVDDTANLDYFGMVAGKLESYGWRGTFAMYTGSATTGNYDKALKYQAAGHEISSHTRNHTDLTKTETFTVQKAGETITCDGTTLTTSGGHSYVLSSYSSVGTLRDAMVADGYICSTMSTLAPYLGASAISPKSLANVEAGTSINAAYALPLNTTRYWTNEVTDSISDMTSHGIDVSTMVPPGNNTSAELRSFLVNTSLMGARGSSNDTLSSANAYNLSVDNLALDIGITTNAQASGLTRDQAIRRAVAAAMGRMESGGFVRVFLAHNITEFSSSDWDSMLDTVAQFGVKVMTMRDAITYIKTYNPSGDVTTADNLTYTRTLIDQSNYHLLPGSHASKTGASSVYAGVPNVTDFDGKRITDGSGNVIVPWLSMGAYQFIPKVNEEKWGFFQWGW